MAVPLVTVWLLLEVDVKVCVPAAVTVIVPDAVAGVPVPVVAIE
ncbi:hypothetical protein [Flavobacterium sp. N2038]|nr:hypothetical protein [Flavobacterium sp. N2038]